jgi:hypothetical protein
MDSAGFNLYPSNRDQRSSIVAPSVHKYDFLDAKSLRGLDNRRFIQKGVGHLGTFSFNIDC